MDDVESAMASAAAVEIAVVYSINSWGRVETCAMP